MDESGVLRDDISNSADAVTDGTGFRCRIEGGVDQDVGFEARFPGVASGTGQSRGLGITVYDNPAGHCRAVKGNVAGS